MGNDLVSIIMLSHDKGRFVRESVDSVMAQTYQNWEIIFRDDSSEDDTIKHLMELKEECKWKKEDGTVVDRLQVYQSVFEQGTTSLRNSALKVARGRWIAFLDVGDVWMPDKLEKQIRFMEENGYAFSYTKYRLCGRKKKDGELKCYDRGYEIGGKDCVTYDDMLKCCWPAYLTVMYDASKVGLIQAQNLKSNNDYALWLKISEENDCYLLNEFLARLRTPWGLLGKLFLTNRIKWRYEVYLKEEEVGMLKSVFYAIRNLYYGIVKWAKYAKRK